MFASKSAMENIRGVHDSNKFVRFGRAPFIVDKETQWLVIFVAVWRSQLLVKIGRHLRLACE